MKAAIKATLAAFGLRIVRDQAMRPKLRRALSGALKHQPVVPNVFGHDMHVDPNDAGMAIWKLSGQHAENCFDPEVRLLLRTIKSGDCVVDIGANVGFYTLLFARTAGPDGRVIAFEPSPRSITLLRQNLAINGYLYAVAEQAAVSDKSGTAELVVCPTGESDNRLVAMMPSPVGEVIAVKMVSLDDYFDAETRIDFLKIDAQGAETAILRGARRVIGQNPNLKIVMEYSPYALAAARETPSEFFDLVVNDLGLTIAELDDQGREQPVTTDDLLARSWTNGNDQTTLVLHRCWAG
jgi:FkbM family methyltransferase